MPAVLSCNSVKKSFSSRPLLDGLTFSIEEGEHLGVLGPNGAGKSTLLRMLAGLEEPDDGVISRRKELSYAYLPQEEHFRADSTLQEVLEHAVDAEHLSDEEKRRRIGEAKSIVGFSDLSRAAGELSGGWKKRLAIACQLVRRPDVLLLDEPTNHLDLEGISWLERFLTGFEGTFILISHDRMLLENVTSRVIEVNRAYPQGFFSVDGNYSRFLEKRGEFLEGLARYEDSLRNKVRREVEWLRQGVKARGTKAKGRIQEAGRLIAELKQQEQRSTSQGTASFEFLSSERKTKKLISAEKVSKTLGDRVLFKDITFLLSPGVRIGVLGENGSGKSTLLRVLDGSLKPDSGKVLTASQLRIVSFDQNRDVLDRDDTVKRSVAPEGDSVVYRGQSLHAAAWLKRFLFRPEQLEMPVRSLSGGEQARLLIAKLMLQPADVLLLDEPTNDLDIETLQVLEESIEEFPGAVVLVTHDRYMLSRLAGSILGLFGEGRTGFFATYDQYEAQREALKKESKREKDVAATTGAPEKKKLSYKDQRELTQVEQRIESLEQTVSDLKGRLFGSQTGQDGAKLAELALLLANTETELATLLERWSELEAKRG